MSKEFVETLLFGSVAVNAAMLLFFAGVFAKIMNAIQEAAFKNIIELLYRFSSKSPFMIIALNAPFLIAIPYYYFYGFGKRWLTAGLVLWLAAGVISKVIKVPVYKAISSATADDVNRLQKARRQVNNGNVLQAVLYCAATILVAVGVY